MTKQNTIGLTRTAPHRGGRKGPASSVACPSALGSKLLYRFRHSVIMCSFVVALLARSLSAQCPVPDPSPDPVFFDARIEFVFDDGFLNPAQNDPPHAVLGGGFGVSFAHTEERRDPSIPATATRRFECSGSAGGTSLSATLTTTTFAQARLIDPLYSGGAQSLVVDLYVRGPAGTPFIVNEEYSGGLVALRNPGSGTETNLHAYHNSTYWNGPSSRAIPSTASCSSTGVTTARHPPGGPTEYTYATTVRQTIGGHAFHTGLCPFCPATLYTYQTTATINWSATIGTGCCPQDDGADERRWNWSACGSDLQCIRRFLQNNCWTYAVNKDVSSGRNPLGLDGCFAFGVEKMQDAAAQSGLTPATPQGECTNGCLVALWARPGLKSSCRPLYDYWSQRGDYHWWRRNNDGSWSHKRGKKGSAERVPNPTPIPPHRSGYDFVGLYCVPCNYDYSSPSPPPPTPIPPDALRVSPQSFSGSDDPYVDTADPELTALARSATRTGPIQPIAPPSVEMGFRGFFIEVGDEIADLPFEIEVRDGQVIYPTDTGLVARQDVLGLGALVEGMAIGSFGWGCLIHDRCRADMNCDGGVTVDDLLEYLVPFIDGVHRADVDDGSSTGTPDGGVTIDDLLYFLGHYSAGC